MKLKLTMIRSGFSYTLADFGESNTGCSFWVIVNKKLEIAVEFGDNDVFCSLKVMKLHGNEPCYFSQLIIGQHDHCFFSVESKNNIMHEPAVPESALERISQRRLRYAFNRYQKHG